MGFFSGNKSLGKLESWVSKRISDPSAASDFFTAQILMSLQLLKAHVSDVRRSLVERWHSCQLLLSGSSLEKLMSTRGRRGDSGCVFFAVVCACSYLCGDSDAVTMMMSALHVCVWNRDAVTCQRWSNEVSQSLWSECFRGQCWAGFCFLQAKRPHNDVKSDHTLWDPPNGPHGNHLKWPPKLTTVEMYHLTL